MNKRIAVLVFILWLLSLGAAPVTTSSPVENITVILILDNSGSMKTSDPDGLRFTGVRLFTSLLDMGDELGLILFSTHAEALKDNLITIDTQNDKLSVLKEVQIQDANGYTDVKSALEKAGALLEKANLRDRNAVIVLLTDGKPEIPNPNQQYEQETLEFARSLNVPVMAIALTSAAQTSFLDQLAAATKGVVIPADSSSDLLNAYLQALGEIKDRTVIGGQKFQTNTSLEINPALAPYIHSATFVVGKPKAVKVRLLSPDGSDIPEIGPGVIFADTSDPRYSILALKNPVGGNYSFHSQGGGSVQAWMILRSRLRVGVVEPGQIHPLSREMPIVLNLLEETTNGNYIKIIGEANFTALITRPDGSQVSLDRFYDDGTHGDAVANDGNYTREYPDADQTGVYLISIQGSKGAIPVQGIVRVNVTQFPELVVDALVGSVQIRGEPIELRVHLEGGEPGMFDQGDVVAHIKSPSGHVDKVELHQGNDAYLGQFLPVEDGEYQILFETRDVKYQGVDYETQLEYAFVASIIPFVQVKVNDTNIPSVCFSSTDEIVLSMAVTSSGNETLEFSMRDGWVVSPETVDLKQGAQNLNFHLKSNKRLREDIHRMEIFIKGRDRLEVQPDAVIGVDVQIPNIWSRCRAPIGFGGVIMFFAVTGVIAIQHTRKTALPSPVSGTLRHWPTGNTVQAVEIDLTALNKDALLIGSGAACDVMIVQAGLGPEHARIITEKTPESPQVYLEPIGEVRKGYSLQAARFALHHGETFHMGNREFQFLSDNGE